MSVTSLSGLWGCGCVLSRVSGPLWLDPRQFPSDPPARLPRVSAWFGIKWEKASHLLLSISLCEVEWVCQHAAVSHPHSGPQRNQANSTLLLSLYGTIDKNPSNNMGPMVKCRLKVSGRTCRPWAIIFHPIDSRRCFLSVGLERRLVALQVASKQIWMKSNLFSSWEIHSNLHLDSMGMWFDFGGRNPK